MRGTRGGYNSRGSGTGRGTYRSSNYNNNRMQSNRPRYGDNHYGGAGGSSRYNNYNSGPSGSSYHDSRNRDKMNTSSTSARNDSSTHKRSYDTSRDRSDDRKRSRPDDYRRNTSSGRNNRSPPPPPPPMISNNSNYRAATSGNTYRGVGVGRNDRDDSNRHRTSMGGAVKRPMRSTGTYVPRTRGTLSTVNRGMRPSIRGGVRMMHRESADLRIMRRKLLYAQQKDRARVLKIARLTSSLRRRRMARSKSPGNSHSSKKDTSDDDQDNSKEDEKSDSRKKRKSEKDEDREESNAKDNDEDREGNDNEDAGDAVANTAKKIKKGEESLIEGTDDTNEGDGADASSDSKQNKTKDDTDKEGKKSEKRKEKSSEEKKSKSSPSKRSSKKDDRDKKRDGRSDDEHDKDKRSTRVSRRDDHGNHRLGSHYIKLTCIHCHMKCVTFKEYSLHLYTRTHKNAIRQIAMRQRAHLLRLRARQRTAQREIEEKSKEEYESKFCLLCRLHYRQPKAKHQLSEHHKVMKKFLMPYCSTCHLAFKSPMLYEMHRCSLEHIRNKARKRDSDSDNSGDELREIDLNKYLTVDSVGEIDEVDEDLGGIDALMNDSEAAQDVDDNTGSDTAPVGEDFVKTVEAFYCELCNYYAELSGTIEEFTEKHCRQRAHVRAFKRYENEKAKEQSKQEQEKDDDEAENENDNEEENEDVARAKRDAGDEDEEAEEDECENENALGVSEDNVWEEVDKDLGDLLREVASHGEGDNDEDAEENEEDEEDESVLNIDIESEKSKAKEVVAMEKQKNEKSKTKEINEKPKGKEVISKEKPKTAVADKGKAKEVNGKKDDAAEPAKEQVKNVGTPATKPKPQRKAIGTTKQSVQK